MRGQRLSDCNKIIEEQMPKPERELGRAWRDWIIAQALQSEAKRMIEGEPTPAVRAANLPP